MLASVDPQLANDLDLWLDQPGSLPLNRTVEAIGLRLSPVGSSTPHHGLTLKPVDGGVEVQRVERDSPAMEAGLVVGDELIAVDSFRLRNNSDFELLLAVRKPVKVLLSRRGRLSETRLIPDTGVDHWQLDWDPGAKTSTKALRDRWFQIL